ncbi:DgyrCDS12212 [Dimorphilus gyrociliatus]|uniref:DgyrCDS12212 n=1 Tax=Dimorphilus gyrociliatus TaxID=2664684 RepID=A0A7I8W6T8_9ANNE|nr:DgyrCDS12212 [Dimorphilus gyrociliatus]
MEGSLIVSKDAFYNLKQLIKITDNVQNIKDEKAQQEMCKALSDMMERTEDEKVFYKCANVFVQLVKSHPRIVENYFKVIAETTIKWSKNIKSKSKIVQKANELLRCLSPIWIKNLDYSLNILNILIKELKDLEKIYNSSGKSGKTEKQIEYREEMICAFCIYGILLDCIGRIITDFELNNLILPDNIMNALTGSAIPDPVYKQHEENIEKTCINEEEIGTGNISKGDKNADSTRSERDDSKSSVVTREEVYFFKIISPDGEKISHV